VHLSFNGFVYASYSKALDRWRKGWDFDRYCYRTPHTKPLFAHDATPYYWLSIVLLGMLEKPPPNDDEAVNRLSDADYRVMLEAARQFAESGEGAGA